MLLVSNRLSLTPMMVVKRYNKCFGIYFVVSDILHRMYVRMAFVDNSLKPDEGPNLFLIEFRLMSKIFCVIFFWWFRVVASQPAQKKLGKIKNGVWKSKRKKNAEKQRELYVRERHFECVYALLLPIEAAYDLYILSVLAMGQRACIHIVRHRKLAFRRITLNCRHIRERSSISLIRVYSLHSHLICTDENTLRSFVCSINMAKLLRSAAWHSPHLFFSL